MNKALKHTIIAMATASLGFAVGCSKDDETPQASATTSGSEEATEASCGGEASCGAATDSSSTTSSTSTTSSSDQSADEASCGEGSCG